jgi:hypothetical protein
MTSTLRTPTYPSYAGRVIDISSESAISFINNADYPIGLMLHFDDLDGGSGYSQAVLSQAARGATISMNLAYSSFTVGHDYACTPVIYGRNPNAAEGAQSPGKYDVLLGTGRLQADSDEDNTKIYIDKDITVYRGAWYHNTTLIGGCVIKVGNDTYLITDYNSGTGECTVSAADINGSTSSLRYTEAGEKYQLISNYVVGQPFTFKYRSAPTCTLTTAVADKALHITGAYSQAQNVPIQSYVMSVEYRFDLMEYTITHDRRYGVDIAEDFPIIPVNSESASRGMDITCEITTEDGAVIVVTDTVTILGTGNITIHATNGTTIKVESMPSGARAYIWREERDNPEYSEYSLYQRFKYLGSTTNNYFEDYTTANQRTYRYIAAVVQTDGTILVSNFTDQYNSYDRTCLIWQLERLGNGRYRRIANAYYNFTCDVDSGTIERVTGNAVYKSSAPRPKYIRGTGSYDTGTFTAILGTVNSPEAKPNLINKFISMMSSDGIFLLKSDYGDIKIVAITSDPTRTYGANIEDLGIVKVTFGWTEIDDIESAVIE